MTNPTHAPTIVAGNPAEYAIQEKKMYLEAGTLGRFFGTAANAPSNVAGVVTCVLVLSGVGVAIVTQVAQAIEYFKLVSPLITLSLGYMFGKKAG